MNLKNIVSKASLAALPLLGMHSQANAELYFLELNQPQTITGSIFEIVGASSSPESLILNINGENRSFLEGDFKTLSGYDVRLLDAFVTNIPDLSASGNFEITPVPEPSSYAAIMGALALGVAVSRSMRTQSRRQSNFVYLDNNLQ